MILHYLLKDIKYNLFGEQTGLKKEDLELSLGGFFVDVNAETQIARAEEYGLYFSSNIKGVNTNQEKLDHLRKQFGLNVYDTNKEVDLPA